MHRSVLACAWIHAFAVMILHAVAARAQDTTETNSYGERYESVYVEEYGNGSTTYSVNINADFGGEQISIAGLSRYFISYTQSEVAQAVPGTFGYMYQNVPVTVEAWSSPELVDQWYDLIDIFTYDSWSYDVFEVVSVQQTSGDGPDAVVPAGFRGWCSDEGVSGSTNFGNFDGAFATCDGADEYVTVAPGTINVNTHATTVYRDTNYHFQSVDDAFTDVYLVRPLATTTASWGTMDTVVDAASMVRNDGYATRLTGMAGGVTLFDATVDGDFDDSGVQSTLTALTAPRGYAIDGAPAVVAWSAPVQTGASQTLVSSSTTTRSDTQVYDVVTVTQTVGGAVFIGDLGACTSTGTSGTTTGVSPTGSFAECAGGVRYAPGPGERNTNTHTTSVTETTSTTVVTEDWLTSSTYAVTGTPQFIGQIHSAVRDALFEAGSGFARQQGDVLAARRELGFTAWADVFTGNAERDADSDGAGSTYERNGIAAGITFPVADIASIGLAASREEGDSDLDGLPERAELTQTELGVAAELTPGPWRVVLTLAHGWAEVDTERSGDFNGGISRADYDATTWIATGEAGPEFELARFVLRPFAGLEWSDATLEEFTESGPIALSGEEDSASRLSALLGAQLGTSLDLRSGPGVRLWADARVRHALDGKERSRDVAFAGDSEMSLQTISAAEDATYAEGRVGASLYMTRAIGLHLSVEGQAGAGETNWKATAGISGTF